MVLGLRAGLRMVEALLTGATLDKIGAGLRTSGFVGGMGWYLGRDGLFAGASN